MSSSAFESFWQSYPRKEGKAACVKKWEQKKLDDQAAFIVAHVKKRAKVDKKWKDGFTPMPLTFLNQERWTDEYEQIVFRESSRPLAAVKAPVVYPEHCGYQAAAKLQALVILRQIGGVPDQAATWWGLQVRKLGDRYREIGKEIPHDEQHQVTAAGRAWLTQCGRKAQRLYRDLPTAAGNPSHVEPSPPATGLPDLAAGLESGVPQSQTELV